MTISTTASQVSYAGNASTTAFPVPFYFLLATDLVATETTGSTTVALLLNVDYTVTGAGSLTGGTLIRTVAPGNTATLKIMRVEPLTQLTDYIQDDAFPAESHEKALDKLTMICQQLQTNIDNAVLASTTQGEANTASNLGAGLGLFKQKSALDLQFRSISSPSNGTVGMAIVSDRIEIDVMKVIGQANTWDGPDQNLIFTIPGTGTSVDHVGWSAQIHNQGTNADNMIGLRGHVYHDATFDNSAGSAWGFTTEVWSNPLTSTTMIGGEPSLISQCPTNAFFLVGLNPVFKNRSDIATHPTAAVISGSYYNNKSSALLITSQARPSGAGAAWAGVGSGWQTAIRIGDAGFGSGLDWDGGSSGSGAGIRNYSQVMDLTQSQVDLAGGWPWIWVWRTGLTYFGARFVPTISSGVIELVASTPAAAGSGYAVNDTGTLDNGTGATYKVDTVSTGAVTAFHMTALGTSGYSVNPLNTTTVGGAQPGSGTGFKVKVLEVVGEKIEFWRCTDLGDPSGTGQRYGYIDLAYDPTNDKGGAFLRAFP